MLFPIYNFPPFKLAYGEGAYLFDTKGNRYLDFTAGIGVNALGHCNGELVKALTTQAHKMWHCSNLFSSGKAEKVAKLLENQFEKGSAAFFCNSGNEAVEGGIKLCRSYFQRSGIHRYKLICFENAFHGRGLAAISASGQAKLLKGFAPPAAGFEQVPFGDLAAVKRAICPQTAAVLIEPIQGEGGINVATPKFLKGLRTLCDEAGILLFVDEVQCGISRSGDFFAHSGIKPDVIALAKGLGGGFPVGAVLASKKVKAGFWRGAHGSTFGGNPLAMAVAERVLEIVTDRDFQSNIKRVATKLQKGVTKLVNKYPKTFKELRGRGLMLGIQCTSPAQGLIAKLRDNGLLVVMASGNVIRLLPPLNIGDQEVTQCLAILEKVATQEKASTRKKASTQEKATTQKKMPTRQKVAK